MSYTKEAKSVVVTDPELFNDTSDIILGFGDTFPQNPKDGFLFTLTSKERKQQFLYDGENGVWVNVGNDYCDNNIPGSSVIPESSVVYVNYYVVGFCGRKNTDIELTNKEYFTGNLNTLYTVAESQLYPANTCYNDKRMNILAGPFDNHDLAENHKNSYSSSLLSTLDQQCQNRMTFDITWNGDNGCDLDISFLVEGVSIGWNQQNDSPYATWYGDDTDCGGAEQVSIDKNAMIADGIKTTTVVLRAHWHGPRGNGDCNFVASDGNTSIMRSFNSATEEPSSNTNYDVLGSVMIDLENDTFTVTEGEEQQEVSRSNSLLTLLPEDLR